MTAVVPVDVESLPTVKDLRPQVKHKLLSWSTRKLLRLKDKLEERVRVRALAALHDAIPNMADHAARGGARDAPAAMRELRALALPERQEAPPPPTSPGADVARILEALPRLLDRLPATVAAGAPRLLAAADADYELLEPRATPGAAVAGAGGVDAHPGSVKAGGGGQRVGPSAEVSPPQPQVAVCVRHNLENCAACGSDRTHRLVTP